MDHKQILLIAGTAVFAFGIVFLLIRTLRKKPPP